MSNYKMCLKCLSSYEDDKQACPFCGSENKNTNPAGALELGTVLGGKYTIGNFIEIDGEGVIYSGVDNSHKKRVLIKEFMPVTLCSGRQGNNILPRGESEVLFKTAMMEFSEVYRSLINMNGEPALSRVEDIIAANGTAYAITEYVDGDKLEEYLDRFGGRLDWRDAMALLEPVFIAMEKLHRIDWMHKGISPENIIVTADGVAKLVGYSTLALRTSGSEFKAQLYTGYSAPEQYSVTEYQGAYTDIYAMAAVIYRTITGRRPMAVRDRERADNLEPISALASVPKYFAAAVSRAMRLTPGERFQNVEEFREALANVSRQSGAAGAQKIGFEFNDKNKMILYIVAGVVGMILIIVILWAIIRSNLPQKNIDSSLIESSSVTESSSDISDISSSTEIYTIPNFAGKNYKDVQNNYPQFIFVMEEEYNNNYAEGEIISQSPMEGSAYVPGSAITLKVSKGPETKQLPSVIGLSQASAESVLKDAGIRYSVVKITNDGSYTEGNVVKTDKAEGSQIRVELDTVVLYVADKAPTISSSSESSSDSASSSGTNEA